MDILQELKEDINLLKYIEWVTRTKATRLNNNEFRINPCPICKHNDHFTIYTDTNSYNSFSGCCKSGTIIDFQMEYYKMELSEAITALKEYSKTEDYGTLQKSELDYSSLIDEWHLNINKTNYFIDRGLTKKTISKYKLGYNPIGGEYGHDFKYLLPVSNNFVIYREEDNNHGRYRNSKGEVKLLNLEYLLNDSIKYIFITEGMIDTLSIEEFNYKSIALNSKSNADIFIEYLKINIDYIKDKVFIMASDNDPEGQKLKDKLINSFKSLNLALEVFEINDKYKDVNESLQADRMALEDSLHMFINTLERKKPKHSVINYLEKFVNVDIPKNGNKKVISTGFIEFDKKLGGGIYSGLYVLGAISSLGKTTFALQVADYIAGTQESDVLFFSLEMSKFEMIAKSLSREMYKINAYKSSNIGTRAIMKNEFDGLIPEFKQAVKNYEPSAERLSIIEGNFDTDIETVRNEITSHIRSTHNNPVVFIDYLQILKSKDNKMSDKQEIDNNVTELKRISRDFDIPVIVVSSLNRQSYSSPISFESFKESGSIEYTADTVIGLQLSGIKDLEVGKSREVLNREKLRIMKKTNPRKVELVILKNRNGESSAEQEFNFYPVNNFFTEVTNNSIYNPIDKEDSPIVEAIGMLLRDNNGIWSGKLQTLTETLNLEYSDFLLPNTSQSIKKLVLGSISKLKKNGILPSNEGNSFTFKLETK